MTLKLSSTLATRRMLSAAFGLLLISAALVGCTTQGQPTVSSSAEQPESAEASPEVIRIGYIRWGLLPIVKQQQRLEQELAKQNIKVEWVGPFPAFSPVLEAFNAGEIDFSAGGDIPGISGIVGGTPICILAYQASIPEAEAILVQDDSPIQSPQDLVGRKVAVNRGGWGEHLLLRVLADANVPKEQVERVYLGPTDALPAVTQGHVDAWSVWDPNVAIAETEHNLRPITNGSAASHYGIYVVRNEFLAENPEVVRTVLAETVKEAEWASTNPEEAANIFGTATELAAPVVEQLGKRRVADQILPLTIDTLADLQERADWMYEQQAIPRQVDIRESVCPATEGLEEYTSLRTE